MAGPGPEQYSANPLFVSPDHLMLHHDPNPLFRSEGSRQNSFAEQQTAPATHHQTVWASQHVQQPRPTHSLSEWSFPTQTSFRANLPPTPISPFRPLPLRPLSEDEKLAFPCTGTYQDCWNTDLCPKHRADVKHEPMIPSIPSTTTTTPPDFCPQARPLANPRRRSAPVGDIDLPPAKIKRNATSPEETDLASCRYHQHTTISRDARSSLSKGRVPHNLVERRYRDNLNNQIEALRLTLPSLRDAQPSDLDDASSPRMPSKAVIISTAATYVRDLETERTRLLAANTALQEQVSSLQKLMRCDDCNVIQYLNAVQLTHVHLPTPS